MESEVFSESHDRYLLTVVFWLQFKMIVKME